MKTRVLVPSGALGLGYDKEALERGLKMRPDIIAIDGGSTDSGPAYLGKGISKYSRASIKSEWKELMKAREKARVPLLIGTAGTCGTDDSVDWFLEITEEIALELGCSIKVAILKCSQENEKIVQSYLKGDIEALPNAPDINEEIISACTNIVALAGVEQIISALKQNPDIVIAGRATDTAIIAALPISKGFDPGLAWHGAKIAECGALCTTNPTSGVILVEFDKKNFTIKPMSENCRATPTTVSAHMLYENNDPYILYEPGGYLDVSEAVYTSIDGRTVSVSGSKWFPSKNYTVKLEGTIFSGFQNITLALLRNRRYIDNVDLWVDQIELKCHKLIKDRLDLANDAYSIELRLIGKNSCFGKLETAKTDHFEVGVMALVTSGTQAVTDEISRMLNPLLLHHPLTSTEELPTFAFPFSPADIKRGAIYEFCLNHVLSLRNPMDSFKLEISHYG